MSLLTALEFVEKDAGMEGPLISLEAHEVVRSDILLIKLWEFTRPFARSVLSVYVHGIYLAYEFA